MVINRKSKNQTAGLPVLSEVEGGPAYGESIFQFRPQLSQLSSVINVDVSPSKQNLYPVIMLIVAG